MPLLLLVVLLEDGEEPFPSGLLIRAQTLLGLGGAVFIDRGFSNALFFEREREKLLKRTRVV